MISAIGSRTIGLALLTASRKAFLPAVTKALHRIPGHRALTENLANAFFDRGNELAGYGAADGLVDELESRAPLQRLDLQIDLAKLAGTAGLFLVSAMTFRCPRHRLPVRHLRRMRFHFEPVVLAKPLQRQAQMQLAHTPDDRLVGLRVVIDYQARVLGRELVQPV